MGIKFFRKNKIDLSYGGVTITPTDAVATDDGADFVNFLRNRNNTSGWATTDSTDAANTELLVDMTSRKDLSAILLVGMNFKSYTIQYYDEDLASYQDFSTAINVTGNTTATKLHTFNTVSTSLVKIIITGTFVTDDDKFMTQLILTETLGEFSFQPRIKPTVDRSRKTTKYLSGKSHLIKSIESFDIDVKFNNVISDTDLTLIETLFDSYEGFLVWVCGGTVSQYQTLRKSYRLEDIFLMNLANEYVPEWDDDKYVNGINIDLRMVEVI